MRKAAKRKPKHAAARRAPRNKPVMPPASRGHRPDPKRVNRATGIRCRASTAIPAYYSPEERQAIALLMMPVVLVAFALGLNHKVRPYHSPGPVAAIAPVDRGTIEPELRPAGIPAIALRHALIYPPPQPWFDVEVKSTAAAERMESGRAPSALSMHTGEPIPDFTGQDSPRAPDQIAALWEEPAPPIQSQRQPAVIAPPEPAEPAVCLASPGLLQANGGRRSPAPRFDNPAAFAQALVAAAKAQTSDLVVYTAKYVRIPYPMGDLPPLFGACTDVVIRAYRALGVDLQELVQRAKVGTGDPNIDHRRTETLRRFFSRFAESLPVTSFPEDYKPGDIVTYHRPFSRVSRAHIAIVSDEIAASGRPKIIHNRGWSTQQEDALFADRITGHYRFAVMAPPASPARPGEVIARRDMRRPAPPLNAPNVRCPAASGSRAGAACPGLPTIGKSAELRRG